MRLQNRWMYAGFLLLALALAYLPTIARAETASEAVYHLARPGAENEGVETAPKATAPPKKHPDPKPKAGGEVPTEPTTAPGGEPESKERHKALPATPGESGGHPPGGGGGPREGASPKPSAHPESAGGKQPEKTPTRAEAAEGDGGSSPVVPILIAMAVLAALSIGTVIYRGRTPQAG
jgi:hypothetical protein